MIRKSGKLVLSLLLSLALLPVGFPAAHAETEMVTLDFIDAAGISMGHADCTVISGDYCVFGSPGWYAVREDVSFSDRIIIETEMNLILCDGATLTASKGIEVRESAKLIIWAQSTGDNMGKIEATAGNYNAGIGTGVAHDCGQIIIHGGQIRAIGGIYAAGIGSYYVRTCGQIIINGGLVEAFGGLCGSGIGNGSGSIAINGGNVTAVAGVNGSGIGGNDNSTIRITGGKVHASGVNGGAGIGGRWEEGFNSITITGGEVRADVINGYGDKYDIVCGGGAGIGSGYKKNCTGNITIRNATVIAEGGTGYYGEGGAGIGAAYGGDEKKNGDVTSTITIENSVVTARGGGGTGSGAAGIGAAVYGNARSATINIINSTVSAYGGDGAAGIGGGVEIHSIGGEGATVHISGTDTVVFAQSGGGHSSAIGHGDNDSYYGSITFDAGLTVKAGWSRNECESGVPFSADLREDACKYRWAALIEACDHPGASFLSITESGHVQAPCPYCGMSFPEMTHIFEGTDTHCLCGYEFNGHLISIHFDANGGTGEMADVSYIPESLYTTPRCGFTAPEGCRFGGWDVIVEGSGSLDPVSGVHSPGEMFMIPGSGNVTLRATWIGSCAITFDANGGTGSMTPDARLYGEEYTLPPCGFTEPEWHDFAGWQVAGGDGSLKQPLETIVITGATVIKAVWERPEYTVTFSPGVDTVIPAQTVLKGETAVQPAAPVREGNIFLGWTMDGTIYDFSNTPVTGNITLTAVWASEWSLRPDFVLPNDTVTIEANAFENVRGIKVVDAHNCTAISKEAFKGCTSLIQIRLAGNCTIDPTAFDPNQVIYVFAPAGGCTEAFCNGDNNLIFIEEATTQE